MAAPARDDRPFDYSHWDKLEVDDEGEEEAPVLDPKEGADFSATMMNLSTWLSMAVPKLCDTEMVKLVRFIAIQKGANGADNSGRRDHIIAHLDTQDAPAWERAQHTLLWLCWHAQDARAAAVEDAGKRAAVSKGLLEAMGALNTLAACIAHACADDSQGARTLFDALKREPAGDLAKRYAGYQFAQETIAGTPRPPTDAAEADAEKACPPEENQPKKVPPAAPPQPRGALHKLTTYLQHARKNSMGSADFYATWFVPFVASALVVAMVAWQWFH